MRRPTLLLCALTVGLAAVISVAFGQQKQPTKGLPEDKKAATPTPDAGVGDGLIVNDTNVMVSFSYLDTDNRVYTSKSNVNLNSGSSAELIKRAQFYLCPLPEVEYDELRRAYDNRESLKVPAAAQHPDGPLQVMRLQVSLFTAERRAAAAAAINNLLQTDVTGMTNIALVPYRAVWISVRTPSGKKLVGFTETVEGRDSLVRVEVIGTDEQLKEIVADPKFECEFTSPGFVVKENRLSVSLNTFVRHGFQHFLTGRADFTAWQKARGENHALGLTLGPIAFARANFVETEGKSGLKNAVTRDQVLRVTGAAIQTLAVARWIESPESADDLPKLSEALFTSLLTRATATKVELNTQVNKIGNEFVVKVTNDLSPDVITEVGQKLSQKNKMDSQKKGEVGKEGVTVKDEQTNNSQNDIEWDTKQVSGTLVTVPKSVNLFQFSSVAFNDQLNLDWKDIRAVADTKARPRSVPVLLTRRLAAKRELRSLEKDVRRRVSDRTSLKLIAGHGKMDTSSTETAVYFSMETRSKANSIIVAVTYHVENFPDRVRYGGTEEFTFEIPNGERLIEMKGNPKLEFEQPKAKLLIQGKTFASQMRFERRPGGLGKPAYDLTLTNDAVKAAPKQCDLKGDHVRSLTLNVDADDHTGNMDLLHQALGYQLKLDIPYVAELTPEQVVRVDPLKEPKLEDLKK